MRSSVAVCFAILLGCGGAATPGGASPNAPNAASAGGGNGAAPSGDPFAVPSSLRDDTRLLHEPPVAPLGARPLLPAPPGVAPPPPACTSYVQRKPSATRTCTDAASALVALDKAMAETDPARRDAALTDLESCAAIPVGLARALRADLAPSGCADVLVQPLLVSPPARIPPVVHHALYGQAIGARLARTANNPPKLDPPYDRRRVEDFIHGQVRDWLVDQAKAIQDTAQQGSELAFYGRALAAIEAGLADLRLVEAVRAMPIPAEMARDPEAKNVYYAKLDEVLEPRKQRGRDAALVGLRELGTVGVLRDGRIARARKLLSELYGGRRIDALDALLLPPLPPPPAGSIEERLAARLPTFYAGIVLDGATATRPGVLRALLEQGVPMPHRIALQNAQLGGDAKALYARARFELGRTYWRAADFDRAIALASGAATSGAGADESKLLLAVSLALHDTPEDAADLMRKAAQEPLGVVQTAALDALARTKPPSRYAGMAAFDAALIRMVGAPRPGSTTYWKDVATRYREAAALLVDPTQRGKADEYARAADATAAALK